MAASAKVGGGLWSALRAPWSGGDEPAAPEAPEHLSQPIFYVDARRKLRSANAAGRELAGLGADETWVGSKITRWLPEAGALAKRPPQRTRAGHRLHDLTLLHSDGARVPVEVGMAPIGDTGWSAITATDLSDRKGRMERLAQSNDRLTRARDDALEQSQAKTMMLSRVAKVLQVPVSAISGYADLLASDAREPGDDRMSADVEGISKASQSLLGMLRNILDLAEIEAGRMAVLQNRVDIGNDVQELIERHRDRARARGNTISFVRLAGLGEAYADRERVLQIIDILLDNAVRFTMHGTITVRILREPVGNQEHIVVQVSDTGVGIPKDRLEALFDGHDAGASNTSSAGIGLVVGAALARLMDGRLSVNSTKGVGSTFTLDLPAFTTQHDENPPRLSVTGLPVPRRVSQSTVQVAVRDTELRSQAIACLERGGWGVHAVDGPDGEEAPDEDDCVVLVGPGPEDDPVALVEHARARNPNLPLIAVLRPSVAPAARLRIAALAAAVRTVEEDAEASSWDDALHGAVMRSVMMHNMRRRVGAVPPLPASP